MLAYVILCTLPCFAVLIVSSKVTSWRSDRSRHLLKHLLLFAICVVNSPFVAAWLILRGRHIVPEEEAKDGRRFAPLGLLSVYLSESHPNLGSPCPAKDFGTVTSHRSRV